LHARISADCFGALHRAEHHKSWFCNET
jgi:hypothetical protein